jgi:succinoglycan biosynthesis protein ExoA
MDPLISVVIPCRNEVNAIGACVDAIFSNDYSNVEVLVVDGMSTDGTRERVESMRARYPRLRVIDNPKQLTP